SDCRGDHPCAERHPINIARRAISPLARSDRSCAFCALYNTATPAVFRPQVQRLSPIRAPPGPWGGNVPSLFPNSKRALRREDRRSLLAQRAHALLHFGSGKAEELERQRGVEAGAGEAEPVVERVF